MIYFIKKDLPTAGLQFILTFFFLISLISESKAVVGNAVSNGYYATSSTWSFNGTNRVPTCNDTLRISASKTVTVNTQTSYACTSPIIIYVYGTLQFTNGNKLALPCGSVVFIMSGGTVKKSTPGGGSSTLISICGTIEWKAGDGPISGIDTLGTVGSLPIELAAFGAKQQKDAIQINWTTATEINNSYFTIEKSTNGTEFYPLAKVRGAGNSTFNISYSYVDHAPVAGISYYRLKQTDFDGRNETFYPVAVNFKSVGDKKLNIVVSGNPFRDELKFSVVGEDRDEVEIDLLNTQGVSIYHSIENVSENNFITITNLTDIRPGIYFLRVISGPTFSKAIQVVKGE